MRKKTENSPTLNNILQTAFKLFVTKPFDKVTFTDIEKETGLSRGAILYHISNKETLFDMVLERLVLGKSSISSLNNPSKTLWDILKNYIDKLLSEHNKWKSLGIDNPNKAFMNIECSAFYYKSDMSRYAKDWVELELSIWKEIIDRAKTSGEIRSDINSEYISRLFFHTYMGVSYAGIANPTGCDYNNLKEQFVCLYNEIKS